MKQYNDLLRGFILALFLIVTVTAYSQEAKKLRIQTSASAKETVHKPLKKVESTPTVQKKKENAKPTKESDKTKKYSAVSSDTKVKAKKRPVDSSDTKVKAKAKAKPTTKAKAKQTSPHGERRYIALKTNVPFLAVAVQNLAVEVQLAKHITLDLPVMWSISDIEREHALRTFALQPEARWWLKSAGTGHFFGLHAHVAWFNAKWDADRYQTRKRPLVGVGLSYGYKLPLSDHWGAEFNLGAGYANMQYNTYYNIENGAMIDTRNRHYWGITRAGISLVYRF